MTVKRRWTIAICVMVMPGVGILFTLLSTPVYQANTTVQIEQQTAKIVPTHGDDVDDHEGQGDSTSGPADATLLSNATVGAMILIEAGRKRIGQIKTAIKRLSIGRSHIVGAVITKFNPKNTGYGYGYSESDYRYGAKSSDPRLAEGDS